MSAVLHFFLLSTYFLVVDKMPVFFLCLKLFSTYNECELAL